MWVKVKWAALGILGNTDQNMGGFGEDKGMWTTACRSRVLLRRRQGVRYRWEFGCRDMAWHGYVGGLGARGEWFGVRMGDVEWCWSALLDFFLRGHWCSLCPKGGALIHNAT